MTGLRAITPADSAEIKQWPPYGSGFEQMDYALRDKGWLDEFRDDPRALVYAAVAKGRLVGFSLLNRTEEGSAEFRIAIHPERTGEGLGREVTLLTLKEGFRLPGLRRVRLIVRKNNPRARRLYERLGFVGTGEILHRIQGNEVAFIDMEMSRERYDTLRAEEGA